jgi:hypothetical protein
MTTLSEEGFLSDEVDAVVRTIRAKQSPWFTELRVLNRLLVEAQYTLEIHVESAQESVCAALYVRGLTHSQAAVILIERGMVASAKAMARCALEALFKLGACAREPARALALLDEDEIDKLRRARRLAEVQDPEIRKAVTERNLNRAMADIQRRVAELDAREVKDYHLHEFIVIDAKTSRVKRIGIPDDEMPDEWPCLAGWNVPIGRYLTYGTDPVRYRYDFGDDWEHTVEFEELLPADEGGAYPRCLGGAGACPPEDVGGTTGYAEFLRTIGDQRHPERASMLQWAGGDFDAHAFDPKAVRFDNPGERWKTAFQQRGSAV